MRKSRVILFSIIVIVVGSGFFLWKTDGLFAKKAPADDLAVVDEMYTLIGKQSVYDTAPQLLVEGALRGMAQAIKDPYSTYYNAEEAAIQKQTLAEERVGIGVEMTEKYGKFIIISPVKNSPAEKAGVRPYDEIVQIDDVRLEGKTMGEVMRLMQGKAGQEVTLVLYRPAAERHVKLTIERAALKNETVEARVLEKGDELFGYISIAMFGEKTADEWKRAVEQLEQQKVEGWIIDVRDNPGGYLHSVAGMISTFEDRARVFAYMENGEGALESLMTEPKLIASLNKPVVILQNEGSASASEVFAAAMQAWERATIIGTTSFGKGTVQKTWELKNGGEVKLSTNKWLTPTKQWIHGKGITPDIEVKQHPLFAVEMRPLTGTYKQGDFSEEIAYVQHVLFELGYPIVRSDGFFDEQTAQAVVQFRKNFELAEDAQLDELFYTALQTEIKKYKEQKEHDLQLEMGLSFLLHALESNK